jgi:hypothetical protein
MAYVKYNKAYVICIARCIDICIGGWLWRDYDVTISAQTGLAMRRPSPPRWARVLSAFLSWLEPGHCELAITCDIERAQAALQILGAPRTP